MGEQAQQATVSAAKQQCTTAFRNLFQAMGASGEVTSAQDLMSQIKDMVSDAIESCLQGEMDSFLGYKKSAYGEKPTTNRRNGYSSRTIKTNEGSIKINVPRDREGQFEPTIVGKWQRNLSDVETLVLSLYSKGMSQRDIADAINDIYHYEISPETVSAITDRVLDTVNKWQARELEPLYVAVFVDCIYVSIKTERETKQHAVYVITAINEQGIKDILGFWINETEGKSTWMKIFDELRARGVKDIIFMCMDGVTGLEEGAKVVFPNVVVQRCMVHLMRNSLHYIPTKSYAAFASQAKKLYSAPNLETAERELEQLEKDWSAYPGAVAVWKNNWTHVAQLYNYGSSVRKGIYTTNVIESVNSSLRKVTKKGSFPNKQSVFKVFYLRAQELSKKWTRSVHNWSNVMNELYVDDEIRARIEKYHHA